MLPCRNAATTLPAAAASLQSQTFRDFEVIAVNDGSSDGTASLLHEWARADARVRVLSQPALGIVPALQCAAAASLGDILVRMDADDIAWPARIERQVALLDAAPEIGACGTLVRCVPRAELRDGRVRYEQWINSVVSSAEIARDIFVECPIAHPSLAIRRGVLDVAGGYRDAGWPEDYDLLLRLWSMAVPMAKVPEVLLDWRESTARASRNDPRYSEDAFRRCKVSFLRKALSDTDHEGVVVWGAGPVGKAFARELLRQGVRLDGFVDLDPRKIGQTVHGVAVVPPGEIGRFRKSFFIAAVGRGSAREEIRRALRAAGVMEGTGFLAVA